MDIVEIRKLVTSLLRENFPPLQLSFYGEELEQRGDFAVIGNDYGTELQVRMSDGVVYSIDSNGVLPVRFVNSSIRQLATFIEIYKSQCVDDPKLARYETDRELRDALEQADRAAFSDPENWWACVIDDPTVG